MEVDGASPLDTVKVNSRVSSEVQGLVGTGDIHLLNDSGVEVRLEDDLVVLRYEVLWQPHDRWWSLGDERGGWTGRRVQWSDLNLVHNDHGDNAGDGRESQDDKGNGECLGYHGFFGHGGCFLWSVLKVPLLGW